MQQLIIYIDLLFLINVVMDFVVLLFMKWLLKENADLVRICLASVLGGFGGCMAIVWVNMPALCKFLFLYVIVSGTMVVIAYGYENLKRFITRILELYCIAFLLGGFFSFIYYGMNLEGFFKEMTSGTVFSNMNAAYLVSGIGIIVILYPLFYFVVGKVRGNLTVYQEIEIYMEGRMVSGIGLLDTGNMLTDPMTKEPVLVAEYQWMKELFTKEQEESIHRFLEFMNPEEGGKTDFFKKVKMIPFHSVGNERGLLLAVRVDKIVLGTKNKQKEKKNVLVGIYQGSLSAQNMYQVILHKDLT